MIIFSFIQDILSQLNGVSNNQYLLEKFILSLNKNQYKDIIFLKQMNISQTNYQTET